MTDSTLEDSEFLRAQGFAIHWLHPKSKRPIGNEWSEAPVATAESLLTKYQPGNNVGVRLGEPSPVAGGYLHVLDLDIRVADMADEAWDALAALLPDVDLDELPLVASGSGGESRHLYFITDKPFRSKKLATSEGKHRHFDNLKGRDVWSYDWEVELFGTGKQVAMPPSIHPDTRKPYTWLREFDFDMLPLGIGPFVAASDIEALAVAEHSTYEFESREPLTFKAGQLDRILDDIPVERIDDYYDWVTLGQALHHQFGGNDAGFELWLKHSARSEKFDDNRRALLRKWRSFGKNRRKPVTMATIVEWAQESRSAALRDAFEDLDDEPETVTEKPAPAPAAPLSDLDILGGGDEDEPAEPLSDLDLLGSSSTADEDALDWVSLLDFNEEGAVKPTLHNVVLLMNNDPRLVGIPQLNEFTHETVQRTAPGVKPARRKNAAKPTPQLDGRIWHVKDTLNGELWSDDRDFAIRSILEAPRTQGGYGLKVSDRDLKAAVVLAANRQPFHPVREYLECTTWDGKPRVETLFRDYVGAPDDAYTRSVSRLIMVAAVTRIYEPGHKFDFALILEGLQGKRKSTFIQALGRSWSAELDGDFHDQKQMIELMQGGWILEIPELSGFGRADVRSIKAFISRQKDRARLAYARRAGEFPRQCIFIGSTNDREYLKDDSGGRRFWPMLCQADTIDIAALEANIDQLWAEAKSLYDAMRVKQPGGTLPLYLTDPVAHDIAARLQESRRIESADDGWKGRIHDWLDQPINTGSIDDDTDNGEPRYRDVTCLMELWFDCLGQTGKYTTADGSMLGRIMSRIDGWTSDGQQHRFPRWGKQRAYRRAETHNQVEIEALG